MEEEEAPKPKRGRPSQREVTLRETEGLIALLFTVASLVAGEHWKLSDDEASALAQPVTNIMARQAAAVQKQILQQSDYVALAAALLAIVVPRVAITAAQAKEKREQKTLGQKIYGGSATSGAADDAGAGSQGEAESPDRPADSAAVGGESALSVPEAIHSRVAV